MKEEPNYCIECKHYDGFYYNHYDSYTKRPIEAYYGMCRRWPPRFNPEIFKYVKTDLAELPNTECIIEATRYEVVHGEDDSVCGEFLPVGAEAVAYRREERDSLIAELQEVLRKEHHEKLKRAG